MLKQRFVVGATLGALSSALAQTPTADTAAAAELAVKPAVTNQLNRISVGYQMSFNLSVSFRNLGGYPLRTGVNPGPATGFQENRVYDDGYNKLDDNLNSYGDLHATRFWGYDHDSGPNNQIIDANGTRYVEMHAVSSPGGLSSKDVGDDPQHGFEINYLRQFQDRDLWRWGVGVAFGYTLFGVTDDRPLAGDVQRVSDRFEVPLDPETGERYVPPAPYRGSQSAGPLLGSEPLRNSETIVGGASVTGVRKFDADLFSFRLGPYLEFPVADQCMFTLGGGLALVFVSSDFAYTETVTISGLSPLTTSGSGGNGDLQLGGYVGGTFAWKPGKNWGVFAGAQFQGAQNYAHQVNDKKAVLELGQTVLVSIGMNYSF